MLINFYLMICKKFNNFKLLLIKIIVKLNFIEFLILIEIFKNTSE